MTRTSPMDLVAATVRFCRLLRGHGVPVPAASARDALRTLEQVDLGDRDELYRALRCVLVSSPEEIAVFENVFDDFWGPGSSLAGRQEGESAGGRVTVEGAFPRVGGGSPAFGDWVEAGELEGEPVGLPGLSDLEGRGTRDFSSFTAPELAEVERLAAEIARRLATRRSLRAGPPGRQGRVDLRRTLRASLTRGEPVTLVRRKRKIQKTRLVVVCDVSGSMDLHSRLLLQLLYALQSRLGQVETFVFSTRLERITERLERGSYRDALAELGRVEGWSGGTRIGASLAELLTEWGRLLDERTVVVVLSDGWDTGEPETLADALVEIRRRVGKVVWLNPLLGNPNYRPLTRGMAAALPHVDAFLPAHNLDALRGLARHLRI